MKDRNPNRNSRRLSSQSEQLAEYITKINKLKTLTRINSNSPRTQEACQILDINLNDLKEKNLEDFWEQGIDPEVQKLSKIRKKQNNKLQDNEIRIKRRQMITRKKNLTWHNSINSQSPQFSIKIKPSAHQKQIEKLQKMLESRQNISHSEQHDSLNQSVEIQQTRVLESAQKFKEKSKKQKEKFQQILLEQEQQLKKLQRQINNGLKRATEQERKHRESQMFKLKQREEQADKKRRQIRTAHIQRENSEIQNSMDYLYFLQKKFDKAAQNHQEVLNKISRNAQSRSKSRTTKYECNPIDKMQKSLQKLEKYQANREQISKEFLHQLKQRQEIEIAKQNKRIAFKEKERMQHKQENYNQKNNSMIEAKQLLLKNEGKKLSQTTREKYWKRSRKLANLKKELLISKWKSSDEKFRQMIATREQQNLQSRLQSSKAVMSKIHLQNLVFSRSQSHRKIDPEQSI